MKKKSHDATKPPLLGLVLSGGGAQGAYQAGAIKALVEAGLRFEVISGVSIGALNGLMVAQGMIKEMEHTWMTLSRMQLIGVNTIPGLLFSRGISLLGDQLQRDLIEKFIDIDYLQSKGTELITSAVSLQTGRVTYFSTKKVKNKDLLKKMLLASCAIPGIFPPVEIEKEQFIDGGLLNNTPVEVLLKRKLNHIVVISMEPKSFGQDQLKTVAEIALRSTSIFFKAQVERSEAQWQRAKKESLVGKKLEDYFKKKGKSKIHSLFYEKAKKEIFSILKKEMPYLQKEVARLHFVRPQGNLIIQQYDFDSKKIPYTFELGYLDGQKFLAKNRGLFSVGKIGYQNVV
ncbi:MAG: patatin-like phospholipase family protein [Leptospiraceae bacterium]|nr:patatin-like phospholipase family protein [Leptospiraceae bacterium]MDW8306162.1 patatin-like phospholipase family protein [Leptospiraceae bacterium]